MQDGQGFHYWVRTYLLVRYVEARVELASISTDKLGMLQVALLIAGLPHISTLKSLIGYCSTQSAIYVITLGIC